MTSDGIVIEQRDIVLMPFPFSDLSESKKRPVLVVSRNEYNFHNEDLIVCAITSNPRDYNGSVTVIDYDLESGELACESKVKPSKIFSLDKQLVVKKIAKIKKNKLKEVIVQLNKDINPE